MVLVRFKNKEEHKEVKMKLKEMKEFIDEMSGRYSYRRGGGSRSRM